MINQKAEAFNRCWSKYYKEHSWNYMDEELSSDLAYYFWKSALEQPTNMVTIPLDKLEDMQRRLKEQPTQEPVAWMNREGTYVEFSNKTTVYGSHTIPLYTHPKEWQGLSDDEIWNIANFLGKNKEWDYPVMFAKTIEQALKEKT